MKLPNNYGSIVKLSGNRRKPYAVRVTQGWKHNAKNDTYTQVKKYIGYGSTRSEALEILAEYNRNPYNLDSKNVTFKDAFNAWYNEYSNNEGVSRSSLTSYTASFKAVECLHDKPIRELKTCDLQQAIDTCGKNYPTLKKIKLLIQQVYRYAIKNDICGKNYAEFINIQQYHDKNPNAIDREPFTQEEISKLWNNSNNYAVRIVLIYIYTGLRAQELTNLKKEDVNLFDRVIHVTESKTASGIRVVPIADKIAPFIADFMRIPGEYLIQANGRPIQYWNMLNTYFKPCMNALGMHHYIHDTRHTCISMLTLANVKPVTIKKIVGHKGAMSLTERVYTHLDYKELLTAINKI